MTNKLNRIAKRLGFESWKHLMSVADRGYRFNLSKYPSLAPLFERKGIPYYRKGESIIDSKKVIYGS